MSDNTPGGEAQNPREPGHEATSAMSGRGDWVAPAAPGSPPPAPASAAPPAVSPASPPPAPMRPPVAAAPTFRSWQPGIIPLRPLSFGDFLAVPFKAMRFNRAVVLGGPLLFTLIAGLLSITAGWLLFTDPRLGLLDATPSVSGITPQTVIMLVIAVVALLLADVLSSSIVAPGVARAIMGERIGLGAAWQQMRKRLGSLLVLYVLTTVLYVGLIVISLMPMLVAVAAGSDAAAGGAFLLSLLLMLALLLPAGILITLFQGVARAMVVLEGISAIAALSRTFRLIKGRFWWSVLIVFVTALLINVVASVLQYVGQFASIGAMFVAPENELVLGIAFFVFYGVAFLVAMVITYAYMGAVFALIYTDLRMRHEGFDMDLARAAEARAAARAGR